MKKLKNLIGEAFEDTPRVDKHKVVEGVKNFGIVGKALYNNNNIMEVAKQLSDIAESKEIDLVLLVAPTTPKDRMKRIAATSNGFTYLVSVTGVTGERSSLEDNVGSLVQQLKDSSSSPIAVGFGISDVKHIEQVREWGADGAIVGSALVKRIANASIEMKVEEAGSFCKELRAATN